MAIITLTSDWGLKDHYLASVKAAILLQIPSATIVDISHQVPPFDLNQASFIVRNCWKGFPKGSIHILGMQTEASLSFAHTAVEIDGQFFIGADNGIFSLIFDSSPEKIVEIDILQDSAYFTFSTRDVFVKAAAHIAAGNPIESLGDPKTEFLPCESFKPVVTADSITGKVIYIDVYENVFTNINQDLFVKTARGRQFSIEFGISKYRIRKLSESYGDVPTGEIVSLFSTTALLEIAINQGNAAGLLGIEMDDAIRIRFQ
ncbi:MAG: SAM-dependent chlorinase/fluorinase [Bacteroidales bacterium]|jgi:S-adenosylmethionine hydrolase|nr:SAM-dependent chlorinase/fluorinase [Bacteroidales bacterium]